jgi:hypothetical protein
MQQQKSDKVLRSRGHPYIQRPLHPDQNASRAREDKMDKKRRSRERR